MPTCGMLNNNKNKKHFLSELSINNPNDNNLQYVTKAVNTGVCYCLFTSVQTLICTHTHMHTHTHKRKSHIRKFSFRIYYVLASYSSDGKYKS